MEILEKYKKIIPENTADIGRFSYFCANFGIQKNKTAYGNQRPIINDPSLDQCVKNLVDGQVICLSDSPVANSFVTNPVAVLKPTTNIQLNKADIRIKKNENTLGKCKYRLCLDFRALNSIIIAPSKTILPSLSEIRSFCRGKILSAMDLKDFFFSIELSSNSQQYTSFYYKKNVYKMLRLGMGMAPSPFFSQNALRMTFDESTFVKWKKSLPEGATFPYPSSESIVVTYADDIIIASDEVHGEEVHMLALDYTMHALSKANLRLNVKK